VTTSPRKFISPTSAKRRPKRRQYIRAKARFLAANPWCAWGLAQVPPQHLRATELHHRFGRAGKLLLWEPGFLAVSAQGHAWIDANRDEARKRGLLCPVGQWNKQP
jgi:hypothetical protein